MQIDDETLMALADGELEPGRAEAVRRAVAADPELQRRLHRFAETRRLLGTLRTGAAGEDPLAGMIRAAASAAPEPAPQAAPCPPAPAPRAPAANLNRSPWLALAASAALAVLGLGWWEWSGRGGEGLPGAELAALDELPSGEVRVLADGTEISMIASFQLPEGQLCREYETARERMLRIVLACRDAEGWQARFAARSEADGADYRPASGPESIEATLAALDAGEPLTPEDEALALRALAGE
ncbi:hypothetical protein ACDP63_23200 [Paracoccus sp. P2]|uniref:Anti-sigma factor n=1 Tax=Paracoccus pantotrophus TaxID=82367 RepID=A0A1I5MWT5_PARPN|nr:hypothetical protein [Paracoccus pantotrophus]MDF3856420.1 hypothetical protein [Paracoccus pantotrophus]QLH13149.1 hypothetical protein HYQ43_02275 [Paracoccus pantotrophus]RDD93432.1 hypothetical protein DTW92_19235 [Paracoccus pantotrophus]RKS43532.1 hypothetical protein BDE18_2330 [Paracoccus pantotrophus]RNI16464.1 hypothetical protein EB844_14095 [Paracoccus pantotrophus]